MQNNKCNYFDRSRCKSCSLLDPGSPRLPKLPERLIKLAKPWQRCTTAFGSRCKAKMSVTGSKQKITIGILDQQLKGVELLECPLHSSMINCALLKLPSLLHEVEPYSIEKKTGNLKGLILQTNQKQDHLRLRFITKDSSSIEVLRKIKLSLDCKISTSVNIQPIPHQILEGEQELHLDGDELLWEEYNDIKIAFPAQAFMQVTPEVASKLYKTTSQIISKYKSNTVLDLFCGAGGFALNIAKNCKKVYGIELSKQAIVAAKTSANSNNLHNLEFLNSDLLEELKDINADTVICNPPRRGLGKKVIDYLLKNKPNLIIYSSCDVLNFLKDYEALVNDYSLTEITPFEMFPLTKHFETLAVLEKR